jgi:hypothetical protein
VAPYRIRACRSDAKPMELIHLPELRAVYANPIADQLRACGSIRGRSPCNRTRGGAARRISTPHHRVSGCCRRAECEAPPRCRLPHQHLGDDSASRDSSSATNPMMIGVTSTCWCRSRMRSRRLDAKSRLSQSVRRQDTATPTPAALIIVVALARSYEGSGTFGHSCYEDAAQAAAIMSQQVGGDFSPEIHGGDGQQGLLRSVPFGSRPRL